MKITQALLLLIAAVSPAYAQQASGPIDLVREHVWSVQLKSFGPSGGKSCDAIVRGRMKLGNYAVVLRYQGDFSFMLYTSVPTKRAPHEISVSVDDGTPEILAITQRSNDVGDGGKMPPRVVVAPIPPDILQKQLLPALGLGTLMRLTLEDQTYDVPITNFATVAAAMSECIEAGAAANR